MPKSSKTKSLSFAKLTPKDKRLHKELMLKAGKLLVKRGLPVVVLKLSASPKIGQ